MITSLSKTFSLKRETQLWQILFAAFTGALLITGGIYIVGISTGIPLEHLTGDPAMINHTPIHVGILSNLGVMIWAAAAACAFLGAALQHHDPRRFRFLLISGLFSALLAVDDLLTIHEHVLPHYLHISEKLAYIGYLFLAGIYLLCFIKVILTETEYSILAIALLFFGLSVIITRVFPFNGLEVFTKDGLKFFGIIYWLVYFFCTTVRFTKTTLQAKPLSG